MLSQASAKDDGVVILLPTTFLVLTQKHLPSGHLAHPDNNPPERVQVEEEIFLL